MQINSIELYDLLKVKIGEAEAKSLVNFIDAEVEEKIERKKDTLATKEDLANVKAEMIKWMFIFWIGQLAAIFAMIKLFFT